MPKRQARKTRADLAEKVVRLFGEQARGSLSEVAISHDGWCGILNGQDYCDCDPEFRQLRMELGGERN